MQFRLESLKFVHYFNVLRPLKLIDVHKKVRQHAVTLIYALPNLGSVGLFVLFIFVIYSSLGVHLFSEGYYGRCRATLVPVNATYWPKSPQALDEWCGTGFYSCPKGSVCGFAKDYEISLEDDGMTTDGGINYMYATFNHIGIALFSVF
jgi:hypothetical protein